MSDYVLAFKQLKIGNGPVARTFQDNSVSGRLFDDTQPDQTVNTKNAGSSLSPAFEFTLPGTNHTYQLRFARHIGIELLCALERLVDLALEEQAL